MIESLSDPAAFQAEIHLPTGTGAHRFGDVMEDFQRERFEAVNPALLAVVRQEPPPVPRIWDERTKGASKDSDWAVNLLWLLAFARRPLRIQVGAYDSEQADEIRLIVRDILRINAPINRALAKRIDVQSDRIINRKTESYAHILTTDKLGSHGARPDVVLIDELTHQSDKGFAETLLDNLDKMPNGFGIIATNAGHTPSWQEQWKDTFRDSPRWTILEYSQPSPWVSQEALAEAERRNSRARFNRLWWGVWSSGEGDALDGDDVQAAVISALARMAGMERKFSFVAGLDIGIKQDHSALCILAAHPQSQRVRLADCIAWKPSLSTGQVDLTAVEHAVFEAHRRFRFSAVCYDPHQAQFMAQRLRRAGVPMVEVPFSGRHLTEMAVSLLEAFRSRRVDLYDDPQLVADLQRLNIVERPAGGYKLTAPRGKGGHADKAFAFAIALPAALRMPRPMVMDLSDWMSSMQEQRIRQLGAQRREQESLSRWNRPTDEREIRRPWLGGC